MLSYHMSTSKSKSSSASNHLIAIKKKAYSDIMFRQTVLLALLSMVMGFAPMGRMTSRSTSIEMGMKDVQKALGVAALGFATFAGPVTMPAMADGAVSPSSVYRARVNYGSKIMGLEKSVANSDFGAFDKKANAWFDLFISGTNSLPGEAMKKAKKEETTIKADIFAAVASKDASKLKSSYASFIKVASLKPDFKPGELGQSDSSGYSPTWGTDREYIYIR